MKIYCKYTDVTAQLRLHKITNINKLNEVLTSFVTNNTIRVPSASHSHSLSGRVLDGVPPPGRVKQHITGTDFSIVNRTVLEKRESFNVVLMGPKAANDTCSSG